ncbi:hypothetical protein BRC68_13210 [Halobacteriales archaeon QH_6_64_20]|jgi:uncharacterized membrane protein YdbT with pleckstrin-like domain|nr:MAG: hypothetical protein BRC68_13210 [Halobacteriales archaeon QH_6_64_20]
MTDVLTTARQAWVLAVALAAIYGYVAGTGPVDMVIRVAIQGALIYLILAAFVWWAGRDSGDSEP